MITQCPACSTLFRVVPDQLRISEGWVRCGQCGEVFDASLHLLQEPVSEEPHAASEPGPGPLRVAGTQPEPEPEIAAAPLEPADEDASSSGARSVDVLLDDLGAASHPAESRLQAGAPTPPGTPSDAGSPASALGAETPASPSAASEVPIGSFLRVPAATPDIPPTSAVLPDATPGKPQILRTRAMNAPAVLPEAEPAAGADVAAAGEAVAAPPASEPFAAAPAFAPGAVEPQATSDAPAPAVSSVPAWYAEYKRGFEKTPDDPDGAEFAADTLDDLSFVRSARRRAFWDSIGVRAGLSVLGLVLVLLLAAQVAVHMRDRIAAMYPSLKPALEQLCRPIGCVLQPLRQIDAVVIDSSTFNRLGPDAFRLSLTLRNQSGLDVAMPWLELTLTDTGEQPVVRRVLTPEELGVPAATVLGARSEWTAAVDLGLPGESAGGTRVAGYRLLAFYP